MNRLLHNWNLKLISLGLAVLLWLHVRGEVNPLETAEIDVPLKLSPPVGWVFRGNKAPQHVTVTLSGPHLSLRGLKGNTLNNPLNPLAPVTSTLNNTLSSASQVKLDVRALAARAGDQEIAINAQIEAPSVEVLGVKPASVVVNLQRAP